MLMPKSKLHYGWEIESQAARWYLERFPNARIVTRNFRCRNGEIDLVFEEPLEGSGTGSGGPSQPAPNRRIELVFVEVRARLPGSWETGLESVRVPKQLKLSRAISVFLSRYDGKAASVRVDILAWDGRSWLHARDLMDLAGQQA